MSNVVQLPVRARSEPEEPEAFEVITLPKRTQAELEALVSELVVRIDELEDALTQLDLSSEVEEKLFSVKAAREAVLDE